MYFSFEVNFLIRELTLNRLYITGISYGKFSDLVSQIISLPCGSGKRFTVKINQTYFRAFLQKTCHSVQYPLEGCKKIKNLESALKLGTLNNHQGTYTPQAGNKKGAGFSLFTGVN